MADYEIDIVKNKEVHDCAVPSAAWKREKMMPDLSGVNSPLSTQIWRYMSFEHFAKLIRTSQLYYPRVELLGDHLEGSFSEAVPGSEWDWPGEIDEEAKIKLTESAQRLSQNRMQRLNYVSCWHINSSESELHWKRY